MTFNRFNKRQKLIGALLLITVLAALWPVDDRDAKSEKSGLAAPSHIQSNADKLAVLFKPLQSGNSNTKTSLVVGNLFPQQSWTPQQAPVIQQTMIAPPPPMPFAFAGRYIDGNETTIFLTEGTKMHRVHLGDTIDGKYRVEKVEQSSITLTYLPLGVSQILPTGLLLP